MACSDQSEAVSAHCQRRVVRRRRTPRTISMLVDSVVAATAGECSRNTADQNAPTLHSCCTNPSSGVVGSRDQSALLSTTINVAQTSIGNSRCKTSGCRSVQGRGEPLTGIDSSDLACPSGVCRVRVGTGVQHGRAALPHSWVLTASSGAAAEGAGFNTIVQRRAYLRICSHMLRNLDVQSAVLVSAYCGSRCFVCDG